MKNSLLFPARQCGSWLFRSTSVAPGIAALAAVLLVPGHAGATPQYFSYDPSRPTWNGAYWSTASGGPYVNGWTSYNDAVFEGVAGPVSLTATTYANSLTFNVTGYSLTGTSTLQLGNPTYPGLFVASGCIVSNNLTFANSGTGNTYHIGSATNLAALYNGTNVLTGNFTALTANNRNLSIDAGNLWLATTTVALDGGTGGINIATNATLTYDVASGSTVAWGVAGATIVKGGGIFRKLGAGTLVFGSGGQNIQVGLGAGSLLDVQAGTLTGSSGGHGFWTTNLSSMNIASGASVNFVEAGFASAATTIQLDGLSGSGSLLAGWAAYTKTILLGVTNGSGVFNGPISESNGSGSGQVAVTKNGTGTQVLGGTNYYRYGLTVNAGTLVQTSTNFLSNGAITVGNATPATATSILTIGGPLNNGYNAKISANAGGVLNFTNSGAWTNSNASGTYFYVGSGAGTGVVNQTAGTISYGAASGSYLLLGNGGTTSNNWGIFNLRGGTFVSVGQIIMGVNPFTGAIINVTNGTLVAANGLAIGRQDASTGFTTNYFNQSGGTVDVSALYMAHSPTNLCYLNVTNSTFIATNFTYLANAAGSAAYINLGTGSMVTLPAFPTSTTAVGAGSLANLTFDGGTLFPYASSASFMQGLTAAYLSANGGTINVPSGMSISVAQPLLDASPQIGQLIVPGAGSLTLNGANTYSGTTSVSNGTLVVNGSLGNGTVGVGLAGTLSVGASGSVGGTIALGYGGTAYVNGTANGAATVAGGGTLGGTGTVNGNVAVNSTASSAGTVSPGTAPGVIGTLTFGGNLTFTGGAAMALDINTDPVLTTSDLLQVNGTLSSTGPVTIYFNFVNGPPAFGVAYTIITNFTGAIDPAFSGSLVDGTHLYAAAFAQTGNTVTVTFSAGVAGLNQLVWQGDGAANLWQVGISQDWTNAAGSPSFFYVGDNVSFNDTSANQGVNLFGPLAPASVTVNSSKNYVFSGTGKITGSAGLVQAGSGTLTLATANDFSGNTLVANGALVLANGGVLAGYITNNGALAFNRTDTSTVTNPISGSGSLAKAGSGSVILTASNSYSGLTVITNGILYPHNASALGTGASPTVITNAGQLYLDQAVNLAVNPFILSGAGFGGNGALRKGGSTVSTLGGPVTLATSATISVDGGSTLNWSNAAAGGFAGNNVTLSLTGSGSENLYGSVALGGGSIDKEGSGTTVLVATNNTWSGTTLIGGGTLQIGDGALNPDGSFGTGPITNNGALVFDSANTFTIGVNLTGTGSLTQNGAGPVTLANTTTSIGAVNVGASAGVTSVLNLSGTSFTGSSTFVIGNSGNNATGIVNQATGTVVAGSGGNQLLLGNGGPTVTTCGIYNLSGGSLTCSGPTYGLLLGANSFDTGVFTMTAGSLVTSTLEIGRTEASTVASNTFGYFLQSGGTAYVTTLAMGGGNLFNQATTFGQLSVNNATFMATNFTYLAAGSNSTVSIDFGPNSLITLPAFPTTRGAGASVTLLLDGTTLTPWASSAAYISALSSAEITPNGATFNVPTGLSITVPQAFAYDAPGDYCVLNKQGAGTLALTGANTYGNYGGSLGTFPGSYNTFVNQGSLLVNTSNGQIQGPVYVASGATFGGNGTVANGNILLFDGEGSVDVSTNGLLSPGSAPATAGTLTVAGNCLLEAGAILNLDLASVTNAASNDLLIVSNNIYSTGPVTVNVNFLPMPALNVPYTIISAGSIDPAFLASLVAGPTDYPATFNQVGNTITVTFAVGPSSEMVWQGDGNLNEWQIGLAGQWINGYGPAIFHNTDAVTFDDTAPYPTVNVVGTNLPGSITMNANNNVFVFQGSGQIAGLTTLNQIGTSTLVLNNTNSYTGNTVINNGLILISNTAACLQGPIMVTNPGTLQFALTGTTVSTLTNSISGPGTVHVSACSSGTGSMQLSNNFSGFTGLLDLYPYSGGGGKVVMQAIVVPPAAAAVKLESGATLYFSLLKTFPCSIEMDGGTTGEALGQIRVEAAANLTGPITMKANTTIGCNSGIGFFSGVIGDGGLNYSLTKLGGGQLVFSNYNTFGGGMTISAGSMLLYHPYALSNDLTTVNVANGLAFGAGIPAFTLGGLAGTGGFALQATNGTAIVLSAGYNNSTGAYSGVLSGVGSLVKIGTGLLTLTANNTYTGGTIVNGGALVASGNNYGSVTNNSVLGTAAAFGGNPATFSLSNNLALNSSSALLMGVGTTTNVGGGINDLITVNGNLWINGPVTVGVSTIGTPVVNKPYTLIQFTGTLGGTAGSLTATNGRYNVVIGTNGNTITATFQAGAAGLEPLVWQGNVTDPLGQSDWVVGSLYEWTNGLGSTMFFGGDTVVFNDTAASITPNLVGALAPSSVTVNAATAYYFQGNGSIAGPTPLYKGGPGTLFLSTTNTYSGGTILSNNSGGIVALTVNATQNTLGSGPVSVGPGSTLVLNDSSTASAATTYITNVFTGAGWFTLNFAAGTSARNTYVTNAALFAGTIELANGGTTADKWNVLPTNYAAMVQIDAGSQLFDGTAGTAAFSGISVTGAGNSEGRGAIRLSTATTVLAAPVSLQGDTIIGLEAAGATISGVISNGTSANPVNLTDGAQNSTGSGTFAGVISDGTAGGTLALTKNNTGALVLATNNTFSGMTTINGGNIQLNHPSALSNSIVSLTSGVVNGLTFYPGIGPFILGGLSGQGAWNLQDLTNGPVTVMVGYNNQGTIFDGTLAGIGNLVKVGTGTLTLSGFFGLPTYAGTTTVSNGTLFVNASSFGSNTVTVAANGAFGGIGLISGAVTVLAGGTLLVGPTNDTIGTLTLASNLVLSAGSFTAVKVDKGNGVWDQVAGLNRAAYGGTLVVTNLTGTLALGDSFPVFTAASYSGNFNAIAGSPGAGLAWSFNPATGFLSVVNASIIAPNPIDIGFSRSGTTLTLSWPADHLGWIAQSNSVSLLSPTQWYDIPGSQSGTSLIITVSPTPPDVFYRLRHP